MTKHRVNNSPIDFTSNPCQKVKPNHEANHAAGTNAKIREKCTLETMQTIIQVAAAAKSDMTRHPASNKTTGYN